MTEFLFAHVSILIRSNQGRQISKLISFFPLVLQALMNSNTPLHKLLWITWFITGTCACCLGGEKIKVEIRSSLDGSQQPCYVILPRSYSKTESPVALLVSLHSWSAGLEQARPDLEERVEKLGWIYLYPHFRGPNQHPQACGSLFAQQDILDAVKWAKQHYRVDHSRIYLTGVSGGGHMTMLMAGRHPDVWTAASAWVGISDLEKWHDRHKQSRYGDMIRKSCGGAPGINAKIDAQYQARSPIGFLHQATKLPLDIVAGIHDGHTGSVPISHSLLAFNQIASATNDPLISALEIKQLSTPTGRLTRPKPSDQAPDAVLGRNIYLRRYAGASRVTIFEGGHESIPVAALDWLKRFRRLEDGRIIDESKK